MSETLPLYVEGMVAELFRGQMDRARRDRQRKRVGKVVEVDAEKGVARVQLGEGRDGYDPFKTGWIPWKEQNMGANRTHQPPAVGQQVIVQSENGDLSDAEIETSLPSNEFSRPSTSGDEYFAAKVGDTQIDYTGDRINLQVGSSQIIITSAEIEIRTPRLKIEKA